MFYRTSLEGKEPASEKTYRDHDDRWFELSWVVVDGSEEPELNEELACPMQVLYTLGFMFTCVM